MGLVLQGPEAEKILFDWTGLDVVEPVLSLFCTSQVDDYFTFCHILLSYRPYLERVNRVLSWGRGDGRRVTGDMCLDLGLERGLQEVTASATPGVNKTRQDWTPLHWLFRRHKIN
jgi:hypothetical protein